MTLPLILRTLRIMVWDTFRQSVASKLFWGMLAVTLVAVAICASITVTGTERPKVYDPSFLTSKTMPAPSATPADVAEVKAVVSVGFGLMATDYFRYRDDAVWTIQVLLAGAAAGTVGVLLALLWTAGFLPTFLEPQSVTVLLAKPVPRAAILLGKYFGVILFVAVQTLLFIGGTWLALGLATGVWNLEYWLALPLLVLNFATFYSVSTFLAVATRSTIAAAFGTLMVWLLCWMLNFTYLQQVGKTVTGTTSASRTLHGIAYWFVPKPLEMEGLFHAAMRAEAIKEKDPVLVFAEDAGQLHPELALLTSLAFSLLVLLAAVYEFKNTDY